MGDFGKMKTVCQILFLDTSTSSYKTVDQIDYIEDIGTFPLPRKGEHVNLINKDKCECIDYVVQEVKYAYKHDKGIFANNIVVYITIYVKRL